MKIFIVLIGLLLQSAAVVSHAQDAGSEVQVVQADPVVDAAIKQVKETHKGRVLSAKRAAGGKVRVKLLTPKGLIKIIIVENNGSG